jgi:hypothetical protein
MMTSMDDESRKVPVRRSGRWIAGAALIGIGALMLLGQLTKSDVVGMLFLPGLGLIFLVWGVATHKVGLLIPGGILSGIGLGATLIEGPLHGLGDEAKGGAFLLCFALGWGLIVLLSALFTAQVHWWPLIPGSVMALVGGALLAGGVAPQILTVLGYIWPVALIIFGVWLVLRNRALHRK